jgi:hypothetical protein
LADSLLPRTPDKRALSILFSTYWSPTGWKKQYTTDPQDRAYAIRAGVMFEPKYFAHDDMVAWALRSRDQACRNKVACGFLASLSSRRLDWRSALGSFAVSLNLPSHRWSSRIDSGFQCLTCGAYDSGGAQDLSILNFERFKWGGVRHTHPLYIGFDLEQFASEESAEPSADDRRIMGKVLETVAGLPRNAKLSQLVRALTGVFPSTANERRAAIGILGYCGILQDPSKPGFLHGFPIFSNRPEVPWVKNDWPYPVQWWNAAYGYSVEAVKFWFPNL